MHLLVLKRSGWLDGAVACAIALAVWCLFAPALTHDFVDYDDPLYVTGNPKVLAGLNWDSIRWAFSNLEAGFWQPLVWLSLMLDATVFGPGPQGFHFTNVLLHGLSAAVLYLTLVSMTGQRFPAALTALLFGVHPLHVEPVAWIASRKDVLSTVFGFLSLLAYVRYARETSPAPAREPVHVRWRNRWFILSFLAFAAGLLSKTMLVTIPVLMLVLDWWPLGRLRLAPRSGRLRTFSHLALEKLPFFVPAVFTGLVTVIAEAKVGAVALEHSIPGPTRLGMAVLNYAIYLWQTLCPAKLAIVYPYPHGLAIEAVALAGLLLVGLTGLTWKLRNRHPYLLAGWAWYIVALAPVSGIIQVGPHAHADRYMYVPLTGLAMMLAWWVESRTQNAAPTVLRLKCRVTALGLCLLGLLARWQLGHWQNTETVFNRALAVTKRNYIAHLNLGVWHAKNQRFDRALQHLNAALEIAPAEPLTLANLAAIHSTLGNTNLALSFLEQAGQTGPDPLWHLTMADAWYKCSGLSNALAHCTVALEAAPDHPHALSLMSELEWARGNTNRALELALAAVAIPHRLPEPYLHLGRLCRNANAPALAIPHLERALSLTPGLTPVAETLGALYLDAGRATDAVRVLEPIANAGAASPATLNNLAKACLVLGHTNRALEYLNQVLSADPDNISSLLMLAAIHHAQGDHARAHELHRRASVLAPDNPAVNEQYGTFLAGIGDIRGAIDRFQHALKANPRSPDLWCNLGTMLYLAGDVQAATNHLLRALELNPNHGMANNNLGRILLDLGNAQAALPLLETAARVMPDWAQARSNLARACAMLRDTGTPKPTPHPSNAVPPVLTP